MMDGDDEVFSCFYTIFLLQDEMCFKPSFVSAGPRPRHVLQDHFGAAAAAPQLAVHPERPPGVAVVAGEGPARLLALGMREAI